MTKSVETYLPTEAAMTIAIIEHLARELRASQGAEMAARREIQRQQALELEAQEKSRLLSAIIDRVRK